MVTGIVVQPHVKAVVDAEGAVLLDLKRGKYFSLNAVGATIWSQLSTGASVDEVTQSVAERYAVGGITADRDVRCFLQQLRDAQLITERVQPKDR